MEKEAQKEIVQNKKQSTSIDIAAQMKEELNEEYAREEEIYNSAVQSISTATEKLKGIDAKKLAEQMKVSTELEEAKNDCQDMNQETNEMKDRFKELSEFYKSTAASAVSTVRKLEAFIEKQREKEKLIKVVIFPGIQYTNKATPGVPGRKRKTD